MVKSFEISIEVRESLVNYYQAYSIKPPQYASHAFKLSDFNIIVYDSLKVVFNGKFSEREIEMWTEQTPFYKSDVIGSDEVGTGDFFGPIVVVGAYVSEEDVSRLKNLNVMDSKRLNDSKIMELAKELIKFIDYKVVVCNNPKYNELYAKGYNIKSILAILHNKVIKEHNRKCEVVIDQFVEKRTFEKYVNEKNDYIFTTKGESKYIAIAVASIIARAYFINEMNKLEAEINELTLSNYKIVYGAGAECDRVARQIYNQIGEKEFLRFVKANFNNIKKIKEKNNGK